MTTAEVREHPGHLVTPTYLHTEQTPMTVNDTDGQREDIPPDKPYYTSAEVLEVALAAYERGLMDARSQAGRDRWNDPAVAEPFREQRIAQEIAEMRRRAEVRYIARRLPAGYDYKGGAVDWETGMPAGSGCAWLRRAQRARQRAVA